MEKPPLGIFGAGWVGLVTGACFAERGHDVVVRDVVSERIEDLNAGRLPFHEPGLAELIERNRERLTFTLDVASLKDGTSIFFACVDTPPTASGDADLSYVWSVIDDLGDPGEATLVMKSTVPVGTGERIRATLEQRGLERVGYVSNPEFLSEGRAVEDFMSPDRIVIGSFDQAAGDRVAALYEEFDAPVVRTTVASAEMIKLAANAFLATRISFINEIANVSEAVGADVADVAYGMGLDKRIGTSYLSPGIGYGGSCLVGEETVLVRRGTSTSLTTLQRLFEELTDDDEEVVFPEGLEVLSWDPEGDGPEFRQAVAVTRRPYDGKILEVRTKMGRRIRCTPDHPFVAAPRGGAPGIRQASELTFDDWLPLAQGSAEDVSRAVEELNLLAGLEHAGLTTEDVIVRSDESELAEIGTRAIASGLAGTSTKPSSRAWEDAPESHKRGLLSGLWLGDGSWSLVGGGPSVILEYGTVSRELADGILRLLGELEIVASLRVGRTRKSTRDTYWLRISGAAQVERLLELVDSSSRVVIVDSPARQAKRIAPTGYERRSLNAAWVRVVDVAAKPFRGHVYSLEIPGTQTFVTSGGLVVHNCFPKDVSFLKLLAGNSGYHFQLVSAVIEVNDLQKRRVVAKLEQRLGKLRGKKIALLGLAFKPNTDDMREAPSLVLASRLQTEGADVHAWDPLVDSHPALEGVVMEESLLDAVRDADAAVIVTEWPELEGLASEEVRAAMRTPLIVDGRNLLDPEAVRAAGFDYEGIGRN